MSLAYEEPITHETLRLLATPCDGPVVSVFHPTIRATFHEQQNRDRGATDADPWGRRLRVRTRSHADRGSDGRGLQILAGSPIDLRWGLRQAARLMSAGPEASTPSAEDAGP